MKGVAKKKVLPNLDEGLVKKTKSDDEVGHVLLANCDDDGDWVFDSVHPYHICRDESLFTRVMACEHERVTLPSGEKVVIEAIGEVHMRMHNGIVRKLGRCEIHSQDDDESNLIEEIREDLVHHEDSK